MHLQSLENILHPACRSNFVVFTWDPQAYGSTLAPLLECDEPPPLGPGVPAESLRPQLTACDVRTLAPERIVIDRDMANCCLAGLWLRHGFLDQSHVISQRIATSTGSYWHGIMHRREGDFANAKYWFRRVGTHPVFPWLASAARELAGQHPPSEQSRFLAADIPWQPLAFVDLCHAVVHAAGDDERLCRDVADLEWQLLFDFCYRRAFGQASGFDAQ